MPGVPGVTAIETRGAVTVNAAEPLTAPEVALIVVCPLLTPVAKPAALMVAILVAVELQAAVEVMSFEVPSL
jgi:hypothetical protein